MPNKNHYPELKINSYASCGCRTHNRTVSWQLIERKEHLIWRGQCKTCLNYTVDDLLWLSGSDMERVLRLRNK